MNQITVAGPPMFSMTMAERVVEKGAVNAGSRLGYLLGLKLISGVGLDKWA